MHNPRLIERLQAEENLRSSEVRYRALFEDSPISLWEQDFSEVKQILDAVRQRGVEDIAAYLTDHPDLVEECVRRVRILDVNRTTLRLFGARDKSELLSSLDQVFPADKKLAILDELVNIYNGVYHFEWEGINIKLNGEPIHARLHWSVLPGYEESLSKVIISLEDFTERKLAEMQSQKLASKLKTISNVARQISSLKDLDKLSVEVIGYLQKALDIYNVTLFLLRDGKLYYGAGHGGYEPEEMLVSEISIEIGRGIIGMAAQTCQPVLVNDASNDPRFIFWEGLPYTQSELAMPVKSGERLLGVLDLQSTKKDAFDLSDVEALSVLADQLAVAIENAQLFEQTRRRAQELGSLTQVSSALRVAETQADILAVTIRQVNELFDGKAAAIVLREARSNAIRVRIASGCWDGLNDQSLPAELAAWEYVIASGEPFINNYVQYSSNAPSSKYIKGILSMAGIPLISQEKKIGGLFIGRSTSFSEEELRTLTGIGDMIANALQRTRLFEQVNRHAEQMAAVGAIGRSLAETLDLQETYSRLAQAVQQLFPDVASVVISEFDPQNETVTCATITRDGRNLDPTHITPVKLLPTDQSPAGIVIHKRGPLVVESPQNQPVLQDKARLAHSSLYAPLLAKGEVLGLIQVQSYESLRFGDADGDLLMLVANTGAIAIENARLFSEVSQRVQRLGALRAMDMAISSSVDLRVTLNVLLDQITAQLNVDAACVLLYNAHTRSLEYAAGRGFQGNRNGTLSMRLDQSLAGRAALERRMVHVPNLRTNKGTRPLLQSLESDSFVAYYAVPLIAKGQVKGVLEVYNHTQLTPNPEWMEFLETLAGDAAIAIDNAAMFNDLQRSNVELTLAYDRTLEGWSHALELRDEETEGHSERVTGMTIKLAVAMGISESEIVHVRRGALLHDIGKMGVPDEILFKPGPLTDEEWEIMHRHPTYAFNLLSRIPFLKPALDIPYCHHEWWDGSGYPNGLKGEEIPLTARIFAVVDVWDALLSARPYRQAWSEPEVLKYLREQSGKHFDPRIIDAFFRLVT
jgi:HD-GYP domain-containing protein (c-di-GMP phosphodiesterase class II)/PAS domain-containing protein